MKKILCALSLLMIWGFILYDLPVYATRSTSGNSTSGNSLQVSGNDSVKNILLFSDSGSDSGEAAAKNRITSLENNEVLSNLPTVKIIQNNFDDYNAALYVLQYYRQVTANVVYPDGTTDQIPLKVDWDLFHEDRPKPDVSVLGDYTDMGKILLPDDSYEFAEGVLQTLTLPIKIYIPDEPYVVTSFEPFTEEHYAVETGSDLSGISHSLKKSLLFYEENGTSHPAAVFWDYSQVDTTEPGRYTITGTPEVPLHGILADSLSLPSLKVSVSVQDPGKPELNCYGLVGRSLQFVWVTPPGSLDTVSVWINKNSEGWKNVTAEEEIQVTSESLIIQTYYLEHGSTYQLQVDYEGGQTGILSFLYDGTLTNEGYREGDRDGGDTDGNPSEDDPSSSGSVGSAPGGNTPDSSGGSGNSGNENSGGSGEGSGSNDPGASDIPSSDSPSNNSGTASLPPETSDSPDNSDTSAGVGYLDIPDAPDASSVPSSKDQSDEKTSSETTADISKEAADENTLSGETILKMLASSGSARFSSDGITAVFTPESLEVLDINEEDIFLIEICRLSDHSFSVTVKRNGELLTDFRDLTLMVPYTGDTGTALTLLDEQNQKAATGTFDAEQGLAVFVLNHSGTYFFQSPEPETQLLSAEAQEASGAVSQTPQAEPAASPEENRASVELLIAGILIILTFSALFVFILSRKRRHNV